MEADVAASEERLNNWALRSTGTKEVPQIQGVGMKGQSPLTEGMFPSPSPVLVSLLSEPHHPDRLMGSAWVTLSLLDLKATHLD